MTIHPARLFILLAREAPIAVILRRGPSHWVQMIKWHTDTDKFEAGQWLKGRIYEHLCNLSPDGQFLIYHVSKPNTPSELGYEKEWTAISKPPYFSALALWPNGNGGDFVNNSVVVLNGYKRDAHPNHQPQGIKVIFSYESTEDLSAQIETKDYVQWRNISSSVKLSVVARQFLDKAIERHYRGEYPHLFEFFYVDGITGHYYSLENATWADFDQQGRLVLAKEGKLFVGTIDNGDLQLTELADFNANKPDPQPAPDWAQKW